MNSYSVLKNLNSFQDGLFAILSEKIATSRQLLVNYFSNCRHNKIIVLTNAVSAWCALLKFLNLDQFVVTLGAVSNYFDEDKKTLSILKFDPNLIGRLQADLVVVDDLNCFSFLKNLGPTVFFLCQEIPRFKWWSQAYFFLESKNLLCRETTQLCQSCGARGVPVKCKNCNETKCLDCWANLNFCANKCICGTTLDLERLDLPKFATPFKKATTPCLEQVKIDKCRNNCYSTTNFFGSTLTFKILNELAEFTDEFYWEQEITLNFLAYFFIFNKQ